MYMYHMVIFICYHTNMIIFIEDQIEEHFVADRIIENMIIEIYW